MSTDSQSVYQDDIHRSLAVCLLLVVLNYWNSVKIVMKILVS